MISRESFKPYSMLKRERVNIPELGGTVVVRELSAGEAMDLARNPGEPLSMLVKCILNEDGTPMFIQGDEKLIGDSLPIATVNNLIEVVTRLSGLDGKAEKN
jgi:hypothetical protein